LPACTRIPNPDPDPLSQLNPDPNRIRNTGRKGQLKQCSGSYPYDQSCGSGFEPDSMGSLSCRVSDPDPHSNCRSGSGSRRAKMTHKNRKKSRLLMFLSTECSLLRSEGFCCSMGVLYGGLGISKLQYLIKKI
jgi:hypothetical protein